MTTPHNKTHGLTGTRFYSIWYDMKRRCTKEYHTSHKFYGERGVTFDPEWENFECFLRDMSEGYSDEMTLDRTDPRLDYNKENCRWVPMEAQARNKKIYRTNSLGVAGASLVVNKGVDTIRVRISTDFGRKAKSFSLNKYSLDEALSLAKEWREEMKIKYGYSEFHGESV